MTPERWQIVKDVFVQASALSDLERDQYLAQACAADGELRLEVESLLKASAGPNGILDRSLENFLASGASAGVDGGAETDRHWLGRRIGAYELVARLGIGGMGEVFRARRADSQFSKDVAIKLVRHGFGMPLLLQRFQAEQQILADLDHPNIARLLDAGVTEDGDPFLVMDLVDGEPIDSYCEARNLPLPERLRLFREVCAAVSHAHQQLIVHRDLKPANILVTPQGAIKLLDFGIAKLLQNAASDDVQHDATRTMLRAMTPAFSSPEQLLGLRITTASDVYSLGVVLYHLLTGRSPYRGTLASTRDAIKEVCETDPARPSLAAAQTIQSGPSRPLPDRELDAITLRALRKEPEKRYGSVEQLSEDVRRYLAGLPLLARGDELSYRTAKFVRRHSLAIGAASLVALALLAGLVVSLREVRIAERERALATRHFDSVRDLAGTLMFQVNDAIKDLPGSTAARSRLVTTAVTYLDALASEPGAAPALRLQLAQSYDRLGDILGQPNAPNTGHAQSALAIYAKAIALFRSVQSEEPGNRAMVPDLALTYLKRGRVLLMFNGDAAAGARESQQGIVLAESVPASDPVYLATRKALVGMYGVYAYNAALAGQYPQAQAASSNALALAEQMQRLQPTDPTFATLLARAYRDSAALMPRSMSGPEIEARLAAARKALAIDQRLLKVEGKQTWSRERAVGADHHHIATLLYLRHDYAGAVARFQETERIFASSSEDSQNAQARVDLARVRTNLGRAMVALGRLPAAHRLLEQNVAALADIMRSNDTQEMQFLIATDEDLLGSIESARAQAARGDRESALRHWRAAHGWFARSVPRFQRIVAGVTLDAYDRPPVDQAIAGLARSGAEVDRLQAGS